MTHRCGSAAMLLHCGALGHRFDSQPSQLHSDGVKCKNAHVPCFGCLLKNTRWSKLIWSPSLQCSALPTVQFQDVQQRNVLYPCSKGQEDTRLPLLNGHVTVAWNDISFVFNFKVLKHSGGLNKLFKHRQRKFQATINIVQCRGATAFPEYSTSQ